MKHKVDKYDYVIYHGGCLDGYTSFVILSMSNLIKKNALVYHDQPYAKVPPPNIRGKNIIIMDVAYKKEILQEIFNQANHVTFIDHHDSIRDDVNNMKNTKNNIIIYDEKESGASLTWKFIHKNKPMPLFIKYIKDNDIGAWKLNNTLFFILALRVHYSTRPGIKENLIEWRKLFSTKEVKKLITKGKTYMEYHDHLLSENLKRYSMMQFPGPTVLHLFPNLSLGQYKVAVYNGAGCPNASILGKEFVTQKECDFALLWVLNIDRNEYVVQFRSNGVDVGAIAKAFNGGGHKMASAGSFAATMFSIKDLFMPNSLPRSNKI